MANGPGMLQAGDWRQLVDRGYVPCFRSLAAQSFIRVYTDLIEDVTSTILFRGADTYNDRIQTMENGTYIDGERYNFSFQSSPENSAVSVIGFIGTYLDANGIYTQYTTIDFKPAYKNVKGYSITYNATEFRWDLNSPDSLVGIVTSSNATNPNYPWLGTWNLGTFRQLPGTTVNAFRSIDAINKSPTKGWVRVYAVDPTTGSEYCIAILAPDETLPQYRRYAIPGFENEEGSAVTVLAKRKFIPVIGDDDDLIVTNLGALKMMAIAIEKEENNNLVEAKIYEDKAVDLLKEELKEVDGANIGRPQVQMRAFAMGEIPNMA
jgi:hypothetical protein